MLRVRGKSISWLVKTRTATRKLGSPPKIGLREARRTAPQIYAKIQPSESTEHTDQAPHIGWIWPELRDRYREHLERPRLKRGRARHPSKATARDVKRSLELPEFNAWRDKQINTLTPKDLTSAIKAIQTEHSQRQCEKSLSYAKAALTWALSTYGEESGLDAQSPWWMLIRAPAATVEEVARVLARQKKRNAPFTVEHLGILLARHEDFCRGKTGNEKISPSVRWGLWWDSLTGNRRGAATMLLQEHIIWGDPRGLPGWGLVWWPAETMKTRIDFWLPIPTLGLHILKCVMRDWSQLVNNSHGPLNTKWAFPSTRRISRDVSNLDVVVSDSSLATHLDNLRGKRQFNHRNLISDLPYFSLHIIRDAASSYLLDQIDLAPGAASAILAHEIKGDHDPKHEKASPTTRKFYDFAQRIRLKTMAMEAWSGALLKAYEKAGGLYPQ